MVQTLAVQPKVFGQITGIAYPSRAAISANADPGSTIAAALRNAIKAQYTPELWRPIAQSVFDPLRQAKRDALCAYALNLAGIQSFGATDRNGLFEYFLVDPGMESMVQTSRIRLAISSVQTFIQRCFLNLEKEVKPSIIDSDRWDWMKRYRVWEANRKIFLWPENWLMPEFRENATDLFQALQSTLLQGDITQDLAEQAFTQYLQDLDTRARLDIVSLFNQPPSASDPPGAHMLHVIGRTHNKPQKYFYRTFSNGIWSGWIPVTVDLDGDHIVAVIWRGRLNIFWLTFAPQAQPSASTPSASGSQYLTALTFSDFSNLVAQGKPQKTVRVQLNRTEYYQGKWASRVSSDLTRSSSISVSDNFDPAKDVYVRASIDTDDAGNETAVRIHLDGIYKSFRLTGKNSEPAFGFYWEQAINQGLGQTANTAPYVTAGYNATKYVGSSPVFQSFFPQEVTFTDATGRFQIGNRSQEPILRSADSFDFLPCNNPAVLGPTIYTASFSSVSTGLPNSAYQGLLSTLSSPFFYLDTAHPNNREELTFFVQPKLTETLIWQRVGWAIPPIFPDLSMVDPTYWSSIVLTPQVPVHNQPSPPDPSSIYQYQPKADWLTDDSAALAFGTGVIARSGRIASGGIVSQGMNGSGLKIISSSGLGSAAVTSIGLKTNVKTATVLATPNLT